MAIPVLSRPNAFDAGTGTTFTYTVTGVPSIIRSSKVTVYDSNNNKLLSHLFVSTQMKHVFPANDDPSIIYESGKTSADFINGRQYSVELDVYDTVDGSGQSLGTSNRVSFWCFEVPTIEFVQPTAETTVSSISYTFVATVTIPYPSTGSAVQNKVQSYLFELHRGNSVSAPIVATSGTQYGTGTPMPNNKYSLSYNFGGLSDNTEYFVVLKVTTEQGMSMDMQSAIITTSVEESSISIAEVNNSPCEGCIYISSNISNVVGEFEGVFEEGSGHIDLTDRGNYVAWGSNGFDIVFPMIAEDGGTTSRWGMIMQVKNMVPSDKSPTDHNNEYLLKLTDANESSCIYLFPRKQDGKTWIDLYATRLNDDLVGVELVVSNMLTNITASTDIYILVNCYSGIYEIRLATSI